MKQTTARGVTQSRETILESIVAAWPDEVIKNLSARRDLRRKPLLQAVMAEWSRRFSAPEVFWHSFNARMTRLIAAAERNRLSAESLMHFKLHMNRRFRRAA